MTKSQQIAEALKGIMSERKWTKIELARHMVVSPGTVTRWLSGTHNFTLETLCTIEIMIGKQIVYIIKTTK